MPGGELALRLIAASRTLVDALHAELARRGHPDVRPAHGFALQALAPGPIPSSALAVRLGVSKQAAGKTVDALVAHGYAERGDDPDDARRRLVTITPRGVEVLRLSAEIFDRLRAEHVARMGPERFAAFEDGLRGLTASTDPLGAAEWFL